MRILLVLSLLLSSVFAQANGVSLFEVTKSASTLMGSQFVRFDKICYQEDGLPQVYCALAGERTLVLSPRGGIYLIDPAKLRMAYIGMWQGSQVVDMVTTLRYYFIEGDGFRSSKFFQVRNGGLTFGFDETQLFNTASVSQEWFRNVTATPAFQTYWSQKDSDHAMWATIMEEVLPWVALQDSSNDDYVVVGENRFTDLTMFKTSTERSVALAQISRYGIEGFLQPAAGDGVHFWYVMKVKDLERITNFVSGAKVFSNLHYIGDSQALRAFQQTHPNKL